MYTIYTFFSFIRHRCLRLKLNYSKFNLKCFTLFSLAFKSEQVNAFVVVIGFKFN